jgi:hypothetical protein
MRHPISNMKRDSGFLMQQLVKMNCAIAEEVPDVGSARAPVIFVSGSPRSGTTLMSQALINFLDVSFVDNFAARFWRAPITGVSLVKSVFGEVEGNRLPSNSSYGRTVGVNIHGFHYFWMEKLSLRFVEDLFQDPEERGVDWAEIARWISGIQGVNGKPFLFKGYYPSYFMSRFCQIDPNFIFVIIERDTVDQALSILEARLNDMGDEDIWWSMYPPDFYELVPRKIEEQIVGQIVGINRYFRRLAENENSRCIFVKYEELCRDPFAELSKIANRINEMTGFDMKIRGHIPEIALRPARGNAAVADLYRMFESCIEKFQ